MDIRIRRENRVSIIYLSGHMDVDAAKIIELVGQLIREGRINLLFNFRNVGLIDNNGLSIFVIAYKYATNQGADIKLCNVPLAVRNVLKAAHLDSVFETYDDEEQAVRNYEKSTKIDKMHLRRKFKRMELGAQVKFRLSIASKQVFFKGKVIDLGGEGMFIYSKKTFPVGSELDIILKLEYELRLLRLSGVCIWRADKELQPHVYPGMGIQFVGINGALQKRIVDYIDKHISHRTGRST